jgi:hypothetical protein
MTENTTYIQIKYVAPAANLAFSEHEFCIFLNDTKFYGVCDDYEIEWAENITVEVRPPICPAFCNVCDFESSNECESSEFKCLFSN